jgi:hypothetical protein
VPQIISHILLGIKVLITCATRYLQIISRENAQSRMEHGTRITDENNVDAFTMHNLACLEKKKRGYKNQEKSIAKLGIQKELKGKK